jgi:hypothetical protein
MKIQQHQSGRVRTEESIAMPATTTTITKDHSTIAREVINIIISLAHHYTIQRNDKYKDLDLRIMFLKHLRFRLNFDNNKKV